MKDQEVTYRADVVTVHNLTKFCHPICNIDDITGGGTLPTSSLLQTSKMPEIDIVNTQLTIKFNLFLV